MSGPRSTTHGNGWLEGSALTLSGAALIAVIGWQSAGITWSLVPSVNADGQAPAQSPSLQSANGSGKTVEVATDSIVSRHLFGRPTAKQETKQAAANAPETQLDLELAGIYYEAGGQSLAIIDTGADGRRTYRTGDTILGSVRIERIESERVVLNRGGRREVLPLEQQQLAGLGDGAPDTSSSDSGGQEAAEGSVDPPDALTDLVRPLPVRDEDGGITGFRLQPTAGSELFEVTDLKEGDIVTAVDGQALRGGATALQALEQLRGSTRVTLTVQRDGQERDVAIKLAD